MQCLYYSYICRKIINKYTGRNTFHLRINCAATIKVPILFYIRYTLQIYKNGNKK